MWWTVGWSCGGLVVLAVVVLSILAVRDNKKKTRVIEEGEHTTAWLVQANTSLFEKGWMDLPALVLISPDRETAGDEELMTDLAGRIMELKGTDPEECEEDDAFVAGLMASERYIEGKRDRLPRRFAQGRTVYLAHIYVYRDHLPDKRIQEQRIPCAVIWDDPQSLVCTRPAAPKEGGGEEEER
jgi:hypothetical protein